MSSKTSQVYSLLEVSPNFWINEDFQEILNRSNLFEKLKEWETLERHFEVTFSHRKHYREVKAIKIDSLDIFIKKYKANLEEALQEWKNILFLWSKGFPTSIPIFYLNDQHFAYLGTKKIEGVSFVEYLHKKPESLPPLIEKIAEYLSRFHQEFFFHQDCYLNHFYWNEEKDILFLIDVSRVKNKPLLRKYYQIKDLAQLKFSFYFYFKDNWAKAWEKFLASYKKNLPLGPLTETLLNLKFIKIKRHTFKNISSK